MERRTESTIERRTGQIEARANGDALRIGGHAAVFNSETVIAGLFREVIAPGAFADALKRSDPRALFNHDSNQIPLGRLSAGTLRVSEDSIGLDYEADLPNTTLARDLHESIKRGDVKESSFAFTVAADGDTWDYSETKAGKLPLRTIRAIDELWDVSPVVYPAYAKATVSARAQEAATAEAERLEADAKAQAKRVMDAARLRHAKARHA